jgi:hypothetical protein
MRRFLIPLAVVASLTTAARGQSRGVSLSMSLDTTIQRDGARKPIVFLRNQLLDERWNDALENSLPLVNSYSLQTWRSRQGWIDELTSEIEWQTVVTKEPLQEEYTVMQIVGSRPLRPRRFPVRDSAMLYLNLPQRIETFPTRVGRFYYTITVRITALSDRDMDQLESFLSGDPDLDIPSRGNPLGRGIRRFLLRIAGLPNQVLSARSEEFVVRPKEE